MKGWIGTILLMAAVGAGYKFLSAKFGFFDQAEEVPPGVAVGSREHLRSIADQLNANVPRQIDSQTRLTRVVAREGELIYEVELVNYSSAQVDYQAFVSQVGPELKRVACAEPKMRGFWKHDVIATYNYTTNDNFPLGSLSVSKADCGG